MSDGPLDMRYTPKYRPCSDLLANISEYELTQILAMYGELTNAGVVAKAILKYR
jgi:16S rRNA C1402 N4-methylase RsmH